MYSWEGKISPILAEAKKAVVQAVNMICLVSRDHWVREILCPSSSSNGKVTTLLVLGPVL